MRKLANAIVLMFLAGPTSGQTQQRGVTAPRPVMEGRHVPEMQKLDNAFVGSWRVKETFEVSTLQPGKGRQGTARFRTGPGPSLIEDYNSDGSAGKLSFLGIFWWDDAAQAYQLLTCANTDACHLRGTAKWDGKDLVNSWQEKVDGTVTMSKDSFVAILPSSFRLVSEGAVNGKTTWRVITDYKRIKGKEH